MVLTSNYAKDTLVCVLPFAKKGKIYVACLMPIKVFFWYKIETIKFAFKNINCLYLFQFLDGEKAKIWMSK